MNNLETIRQSYLHSAISDDAVTAEWTSLSGHLGKQQLSYQALAIRSALSFCMLVLVSAITVVGFSQESLPGDKLYSVKAVTDTTVAQVTGRYETLVAKRANDVLI